MFTDMVGYSALSQPNEKLAPTELKNISVPMDLFRIVLPWEKKSEVGGRKSEVRKRAAVPASRRFAFIGGLVLLLLVGSGSWWLAHQGNRAPSTPRDTASAARTEVATSPAISQKSIAVLPFVDMSQAKDQEYLCDCISE